MNTKIKPQEVAAAFQELMEENAQLRKDLAFADRIMLQAVLTHGGQLLVDTAHAEEAMSGKHSLEYNSTGVTIFKSPLSVFAPVEPQK